MITNEILEEEAEEIPVLIDNDNDNNINQDTKLRSKGLSKKLNNLNNLNNNENNFEYVEPQLLKEIFDYDPKNNIDLHYNTNDKLLKKTSIKTEDITGIIQGEKKINNKPNIEKVNVNIPNVKVPQLKENIKVDIKGPEVKVPDVKAEVKAPKINIKNEKVNVNVPGIKVPEVKENVKVDIKGPEVKVPDVKAEVKAPKINIKNEKVNVNVPGIKVPEVKENVKVDIKGPDVNVPDIKNVKLKSGSKKIDLNAPNVNIPSTNIDIQPPKVEFNNTGGDLNLSNLSNTSLDKNVVNKIGITNIKVPTISGSTNIKNTNLPNKVVSSDINVKVPKVEIKPAKVSTQGNLNKENIKLDANLVNTEPKFRTKAKLIKPKEKSSENTEVKLKNSNLPPKPKSSFKWDYNTQNVSVPIVHISKSSSKTSLDLGTQNRSVIIPKVSIKKKGRKTVAGSRPDFNVSNVSVDVPIVNLSNEKDDFLNFSYMSQKVDVPKVTIKSRKIEKKNTGKERPRLTLRNPLTKSKFEFDEEINKSGVVNVPRLSASTRPKKINLINPDSKDSVNDSRIMYKTKKESDFSLGRPFTLEQLMSFGIYGENEEFNAPQNETPGEDVEIKIDDIDYALNENYEHTSKLNNYGGLKYSNYKFKNGNATLTEQGDANNKLTDYSLKKEFYDDDGKFVITDKGDVFAPNKHFKQGIINIDGETINIKPGLYKYSKPTGQINVEDENNLGHLKKISEELNLQGGKILTVDELNNKLGENEYDNDFNNYGQTINYDIPIPEDLSQIPGSKYYADTRLKSDKPRMSAARRVVGNPNKKYKLSLPPGKSEEATIGQYMERLLLTQIITQNMEEGIVDVERIKNNNFDVDKFCDYKIEQV